MAAISRYGRLLCSLSSAHFRIFDSDLTKAVARQFPRKKSHKLVRYATDVYYPSDADELKRNESLKRLPKKKTVKDNSGVRVGDEKSSSQFFKDIMAEIYATKSKRLISIEGVKMFEDAVRFGLNLRYLFLLKSFKTPSELITRIVDDSQPKYENDSFRNNNASQPEVHRISLKALQDWSSLTTPPGIVGVFDKPSESFKAPLCLNKPLTVPLTLVLDNIREPGNLGSIMRTAAGIGCKLMLSQGCTDLWNTKTLRGANGAHFFVPIMTRVELSHFHQYIPMEDLGDAVLQNDNDQPSLSQGIGVFLADGGTKQDEFGIPIVPYTSIDYTRLKSIYLCLGGETHGLSSTLKRAVADLQDIYPNDIKIISRVTIPMHFPIDSLNAANACGIVGYEIARQFSVVNANK